MTFFSNKTTNLYKKYFTNTFEIIKRLLKQTNKEMELLPNSCNNFFEEIDNYLKKEKTEQAFDVLKLNKNLTIIMFKYTNLCHLKTNLYLLMFFILFQKKNDTLRTLKIIKKINLFDDELENIVKELTEQLPKEIKIFYHS